MQVTFLNTILVRLPTCVHLRRISHLQFESAMKISELLR